MKIWALADLHLSFGVPDKSMEAFGPIWKDYTKKIEKNWNTCVKEEDLVLIAGDISWASTLEQAKPDLEWIDGLSGTKLLIKGNHDYWWPSLKKLREALPPSIHVLQNDAFHKQDVSIAGTRLWDTNEYNFEAFIEFQENPRAKAKKDIEKEIQEELQQKIFERELLRLEVSLSQLNKQAPIKIGMTHYPPISADLQPSRASKILEKHHVTFCIFGHLHNIQKEASLFGEKNQVQYILTSCDYLDFQPILIN